MKRLTSKNPLTEYEAMNLSLTDLYMRLKVYEDAEGEGRLLILPCKVGDVVYIIGSKYRAGRWETWVNTGKFRLSDLEKLGKTVFLTREEAEAALMGGADGCC